jgi:hypothetical protein
MRVAAEHEQDQAVAGPPAGRLDRASAAEVHQDKPEQPPGAAEGLQPGDMSMLKVAEEFLEEPEEGLALPHPLDVRD